MHCNSSRSFFSRVLQKYVHRSLCVALADVILQLVECASPLLPCEQFLLYGRVLTNALVQNIRGVDEEGTM